MIERLRFRLSETNPLRISAHTHSQPCHRPLFDMHFELEVGIVVSGAMRRFFGQAASRRDRGQAWLCGMWEPHGYEVLEAPCRVIVFVVWPPLLASWRFPQAPNLSFLAPFNLPAAARPGKRPVDRGRLLDLARQVAGLAKRSGALAGVRAQMALAEVLLAACPPDTLQPPPGAATATDMSPIAAALDLALSSRTVIPTTRAAQACRLSPRRFTALFQDLMGMSYAAFALRQRLQGAADQMLGGAEPLKTVADAWGFTDASHLHRLFLQHYECSPAEYRRRRAGKA